MLKKFLLALVLLMSLAPAFAVELYFTVSYQSYPLDTPGNQGRDVVFEKRPIHVTIKESTEALVAAEQNLKQAYIDYIKASYPAYIERVLTSKYKDDLTRHLNANVFIASAGTSSKAQADIESSIAHARTLGFSIIESRGFNYRP